ncbi:MAG: hypothetical protein M3357_10165 [Actinomycetota bacterium]|nr:hypothetical protein [Actinomycetota bacterium]
MTPADPLVFRRGGLLFPRFLLGLFLVVSGCRVDARVTVSVEGRGGEVRVRFEADREAMAIVGGPRVIAQGAQVADLRRAGWDVAGPRRTGAGGAVIEAAKRFSRPADLGPVIDELSGPAGPLRRFRLERDRGLTRVRYRLSGGIDLGEAGDALSGFGNDPELVRRLEAAGVDAGRVGELLAQRAAEGFRLALVIDLPGVDPVRFDARPGARVDVAAAATEPDWTRPLLLVVAGGLAVSALAALLPWGRGSGVGPAG